MIEARSPANTPAPAGVFRFQTTDVESRAPRR